MFDRQTVRPLMHLCESFIFSLFVLTVPYRNSFELEWRGPPKEFVDAVTKSACALVLSCLMSACSAGAEPIDFEDALTGPVSPALNIPFEKYRMTPAGLLRSEAGSGTENGIDRPVVKTVSGGYLSRDFIFEVDVTIPEDHGDIAYVGFGAALNNRRYENEPADSLLFRIHNLPKLPFFGVDVAITDQDVVGKIGEHFRTISRVADYRSGAPMRFRIAHRAGDVTLSIPALPSASVTFTRAQFADLFDDRHAFLFVANSSEGTTFRNASVRRP